MKTFNNKYLLSILILFIFNTCQKREWNNPFDPECPKEIWTPKNLTIIQSGNSINLTWSQPISQISGFKIDRKVGSGDWSNVASPGKTATSWSDNSLTGGQLHEYKLYAVAGSNQSNTVTASETPVLNALLTAKDATDITETQATLNGSVNANGSTTNVKFLYKRESQTSWTTIAANPQTVTGNSLTDVSVTITELWINENHEFKIVVSNTSGETESSIVTFKTKCYKALIEVLQPTNVLSKSITLNARVNPIFTATTVSCEYGETTSYGSNANASPSTVDAGNYYNDVSVSLSGLKGNTVYYYRIKAVNCGGTEYSSRYSFTTSVETGTFKDSRDGKTYKTVKIGDQWWMAENLAYLPSINRPTDGSITSPKYYVYNYGTNPYVSISVSSAKTTDNYNKYGVLYNWTAVSKSSICPSGWHVPTATEINELAEYLGGFDKETADKLQSTSKLWDSDYNDGATNESGFSGLPGGFRNVDGSFNGIGTIGFWWTTYADGESVYLYFLGRTGSVWGSGTLYFNFWPVSKDVGSSVRCIKD